MPDLLPGEEVIPGDFPVDLVESELEGWGSAVTPSTNGFWAASSLTGVVQSSSGDRIDLGYPNRGISLWQENGHLRVGVAGAGIFDETGALLVQLSGARDYAAAEGFWVVATEELVLASDGRQWALPDPRRVATDGDRIAALSCLNGECGVYLLEEEAELLATGDSAGDVDFWEGTLWWGLPELENDGAPGSVQSETGAERIGIAGDHLGRSLGGGFAAGSVNWDVRPRRMRIVSLEDELVYALDRLAGSASVALVGQENELFLGLPGWADAGGAVMVVRPPELP